MTVNKIASTFLILFLILSTLILIGSVFFMQGTNTGTMIYGWLGAPLAVAHIYLLYLLIRKKKIAKHFIILNIWIILLSFVGLALFIPGYKDALSGNTCSGFFGVQGSCLDSAKMIIFILLYNPLVAVTTVLMSILSLTLQATADTKS